MPISLADPPYADLSSSLEHFFNAATEFFRHLSEVHWSQFGLGLLCLLGMQLVRAWAWRNVLRAAYPAKRINFTHLAAAYLAGAGINAIIPAHAGDVTKVFLVKRQIPDSSYPAVTSSFLVQTVFDTSVGILVLLYAITQGLLPPLPELPNLPAFEVSFWANHPKTLAITVIALLLAIVIGVWLLAKRVRRFWARVRQGLVILSRPRDYMRQVFAWQGVGWILRFAAFWFFLEAFGLKGTIGNVMLVMSVQAIANIVHAGRGGRPAGAPGRHPDRPLARRRPLLLGRDADRDGGLVGRPRLRRDPSRLPHHRLARPDPPGAGGRRPRRRRRRRGRRRRSELRRRREPQLGLRMWRETVAIRR
jgi:uncharacterized membrane protein YbhN (UPF0104 family)